jgi:G3E family GTPase
MQVEFADVLLLNKCDLATAEQLQQVSSGNVVCSWSAAY